ncbi:MAG: hypothetical protein IKQ01_02415 [Bacteroidales bacterium]|nr:hypothetical protein [Bacteroidales bacterium]
MKYVKFALVLAFALASVTLFAQTSLSSLVAAGNKVFVQVVNDEDHPLPEDEVADLIRETAAAGQWESVTSAEEADFIIAVQAKKKMVFNSPRTWLTPSVSDKEGNVLWKGDTYKADATMFNGFRATNTAISKMVENGFNKDLFKAAGR